MGLAADQFLILCIYLFVHFVHYIYANIFLRFWDAEWRLDLIMSEQTIHFCCFEMRREDSLGLKGVMNACHYMHIPYTAQS